MCRRFACFLCLVLFALLLSIACWSSPAWADDTFLPTLDYQGASVPDWSQIGFDSLPAMTSGGSIQFPGDAVGSIGYDLSRSWQAGDSISEVLKLGDVADGFGFQNLNLNQISQLANFNLDDVALGSFDLAKMQSLDSLVQLIPTLGDRRLADVAPIASLVQQYIGSQGGGLNGTGSFSGIGNLPISEVIGQGQFGSLQLGDLQNINSFSLTSIPDLDQLQIGQFEGWQNQSIAQIPGLGSVPFSSVVGALNTYYGFVARHDMTYGGNTEHKESTRTSTVRSISGSYNDGFNVECQQERGCDYLELESPFPMGGGVLGNLLSLHGARWIRGGMGDGEQMVNGGEGALSVVNAGKEPTGRHPFGKVFKVVLIDTDESSGSGLFGLYFRYCQRFPIDLGCTPYVIGPVPIFPTREKGLVLVGFTDQPVPGNANSPPIPDDIQEQIDQVTGGDNGGGDDSVGVCGTGPKGIDWGSLAESIADIESRGSGGYEAVGQMGCDGGGCFVALGKYQFMNYREDAATAIVQQPGGQAFLNSIAAGHRPTAAEVRQYFPPNVQDSVFRQAMTSEINGRYRNLSGDALLACLGEAWYSGSCTHSSGRDFTNGPTTNSYGQQTVQNYRRHLQQSGGARPCNQGSASPGRAGSGQSTGRFIRPVSNAPITSGFGPRSQPCAQCSRVHRGIDFGVPDGTPVRAADGGVVLLAGTEGAGGFGRVVIVQHSNGIQTIYGHVESVAVRPGDRVSQGQVIARSGHAGVGTGPHLHFEVHTGANSTPYSGTAVNPIPYLPQ